MVACALRRSEAALQMDVRLVTAREIPAPDRESPRLAEALRAGALRHALRKDPAPGDFRVQEHVGGRTRPADPAADEIAAAEAVLAAAPAPLLYARVDLVRMDGRPHLSELELIEPSLYLEHLPGGHAAFARAIAEALGSGG